MVNRSREAATSEGTPITTWKQNPTAALSWVPELHSCTQTQAMPDLLTELGVNGKIRHGRL